MTLRLKRMGPLLTLGLVAFGLAQSEWQTLTSREGSTTVSVPSTWILADSKDPANAKRLEEFSKANPQIGQMLDPKTNERQILLVLSPTEGTSGPVDSFNVIKNPSGGLTDDMYGQVADALRASLAAVIKGELNSAQIDLPAGKALKYWLTMRAKTPKGEIELDMYSVMFLKGDHLYVATFSTSAGQLKSRQPIWDKVLQSIKVK